MICEYFVPAAVLMTLCVEAAEVLFYVPAVLDALLVHQRASGHQPPRVSIMLGGASAVSAELIDGASATFRSSVFNVYGQTELASVVTATRPADDRRDRLVSVGRPLPHVDCKITDPGCGGVLELGEVGRYAYVGISSWSHIYTTPRRVHGYSTLTDLCGLETSDPWTNAAS